MPPPPQRTTESVFDQEDKAKVSNRGCTLISISIFWYLMSVHNQLLARLLNSGRPEDLETANRLIKSTIKEVRNEVLVSVGCRPQLNELIGINVRSVGAGKGRESGKAGGNSQGGRKQHKAAQRTAGAAHCYWSVITAQR